MAYRHILIIGCGYIGERVARAWQARGARVAALARSEAAEQRLRSLSIEPFAGDLDLPETLAMLPIAEAVVYYLAPPSAQGQIDARMRGFVHALRASPPPARVVLISTTGVYGDCGGAWIDEDTPVNPQTPRARRRLDAERALREAGRSAAIPVVVLRVPGIYGPGRLPLARLRERQPLPHEAECPFTNRIHADDLTEVCVAAADRGGADRVYNVSDGHPSTMVDYFNKVADSVGLPRPPTLPMAEVARVMSPGMLSYMAESRRVGNARMLRELGVRLRYPGLESGLAASVAQQGSLGD